jgi:hypothetical protein
MIKCQIVLALILLSKGAVYGQTIVGGAISVNTTWTLAGSPYLVQSNLAVMNDATITIQPGVVVRFDSQTSMQFFGNVRAIGTASQPITFTSNSQSPMYGDWGYLLFNSSVPAYDFVNGTGAILEYCIIEYGGGANVSSNGAVRVNAASPFLSRCILRNNLNAAVAAWGMGSISLYMENCTIQNNEVELGAVNCSGGILHMNGCNVSDNFNVVGTNSGASGIASVAAALRIKNCSINGNGSAAISCRKTGVGAQKDSIVSNFITENSGHGILYIFSGFIVHISNKEFFIANNSIVNNTGNGIYFTHASDPYTDYNTFEVVGNTISGNADGIHFDYGYDDIDFNVHVVTNNNVFQNTGSGIAIISTANSEQSSYEIAQNSFSSNYGKGIYIYWRSGIQIANRFNISGNSILSNLQNGIWIWHPDYSNNLNLPVSSFVISKNRILNNRGTEGSGINLQFFNRNYDVDIDIHHNIIVGNIASQRGAGISMNCRDNINLVRNNMIIGNSASTYSALSYQGLGKLKADRNTIAYNQNTGDDTLSAIYLQKSLSFVNNNIYYANNCDSNLYLLYDDFNGNSLNASECYWRKFSTAQIDNVVWDFFDDQNLALINHAGFQFHPDTSAPITTVENVEKIMVAGGLQLNWSLNIESDIAGYKVYWGGDAGFSFANVSDVGNVSTYTIAGIQWRSLPMIYTLMVLMTSWRATKVGIVGTIQIHHLYHLLLY